MLAEAAWADGVLNTMPPAKFMPGTSAPRLLGVWQSSQPPMVTRYFPHATRLEGSGLATGPVTGSGALRIRYFTGKMICVGASLCGTGGRDRR